MALENAFTENKSLDKIMIKKKPKNEEQISSESEGDEEILHFISISTEIVKL